MAPNVPRRYASIPELADYLGVGVNTARRMIAAGEITAYRSKAAPRVVRVDLNEVDASLQVVRTADGAA